MSDENMSDENMSDENIDNIEDARRAIHAIWCRALAANGITPNKGMKLGMKNVFSQEDLFSLSLMVHPDTPAAFVVAAINFMRKMTDPRLTDDTEAAVLLNMVRAFNEPKTQESKDRTYETWCQAQASKLQGDRSSFARKVCKGTEFGFPCNGKELAGLSRLIKPDVSHEAATAAVRALRRTADMNTLNPTDDDFAKVNVLIDFEISRTAAQAGSDLLDRILNLEIPDNMAADLLLDVARKSNDPDWVHNTNRKFRSKHKTKPAKLH